LIQKLKAAFIEVYVPWPINTKKDAVIAVWALLFWSVMIGYGILGIMRLTNG